MSTFDDTTEPTGEPQGIPERIGDSSTDHAPAAGDDGTTDRPTDAIHREGSARDLPQGLEAPGVPDTAEAAAGPTEATTSGSGPAPAAGQAEPASGRGPGPTDSVGAAAAAADEPGAGTGASAPEPGANGGMDSRADAGVDPVTELAEDVGLAPGASDAVDPGQDNGLNN